MEYSPLVWVNIIPTILKNLNNLWDKIACLIDMAFTTINIHALQHRHTVTRVCKIYKLHCNYLLRLLRQHLPNLQRLLQKGQDEHVHRNAITARLLSKSHTIQTSKYIVNPSLLLGLFWDSLQLAQWKYLHQYFEKIAHHYILIGIRDGSHCQRYSDPEKVYGVF